MSSFEANVRAAAVDTLGDYAQAASVPLNITSARPRKISAPHAYVDKHERSPWSTPRASTRSGP